MPTKDMTVFSSAHPRFGPDWVNDPSAFFAITEGGLWREHLVRWRPVTTEEGFQPARPAGEFAADDNPAEPAGSVQLLQQIVQRIEDIAQLLKEMRAEHSAGPQSSHVAAPGTPPQPQAALRPSEET